MSELEFVELKECAELKKNNCCGATRDHLSSRCGWEIKLSVGCFNFRTRICGIKRMGRIENKYNWCGAT